MSNALTFAASLAQIVLDPGEERRYTVVLAGELKHPPDWIRLEAGDRESLVALGRSYIERPINLIVISPDGTVRDGNRRLDGILEALGPDQPVQACITNEEVTPAVSLEIMLSSSEHTKSLTPYEQFRAYSEWLKLNDATARELAAKIHRSEGMVSQIMALAKCGPDTHEAAKAGKIGPTAWAEIAKSRDFEDQKVTLGLKLGGASRSDLAASTRKPKATNVVRSKTLVCPLSTGMTVTIKGDEASLEEYIGVLKEAIKALKDGASRGYTAKTFSAAQADIAAAG